LSKESEDTYKSDKKKKKPVGTITYFSGHTKEVPESSEPIDEDFSTEEK
jgi:hypothetical protein